MFFIKKINKHIFPFFLLLQFSLKYLYTLSLYYIIFIAYTNFINIKINVLFRLSLKCGFANQSSF